MLARVEERELLDWLFEVKAVQLEIVTRAKRNRHVECRGRERVMSNGFACYRYFEKNAEQN